METLQGFWLAGSHATYGLVCVCVFFVGVCHMSSVQNLRFSGIILSMIVDDHNPSRESLSTNRYKGTTQGFRTLLTCACFRTDTIHTPDATYPTYLCWFLRSFLPLFVRMYVHLYTHTHIHTDTYYTYLGMGICPNRCKQQNLCTLDSI